jgi:hypothetical protein
MGAPEKSPDSGISFTRAGSQMYSVRLVLLLSRGERVSRRKGGDSGNDEDRVLVYRLSIRAFLTCTENYKLFYLTFFIRLRPCVLCVFGLCILEPVLYSVALTTTHLNGAPILSLHNIRARRSPTVDRH